MYQRSILVDLPKSQSLNVEFKDICYNASTRFRKTKKPILKGISGCFKSGELTALMGPSGAGKSSLMNILTGFQRKGITGSISFGSNDQASNWNEYKKQSCYIQQDDNLHHLFTVLEVMKMATDMKVGHCLSSDMKESVIHSILQSLDLIKVKDNHCDKISGGQRKRLSIALELIDNPPIMFLDEPTTGLDYSTSYQLVLLLKNLARNGRTIICTIHQPSAHIYEMFDHVYVLAEGRCVYQGDSKNTVSYFSSLGFVCPKYHNPADYMIEVICKEYGDHNNSFVMAATSSNWRSTSSDIPVTKEVASDDKTMVLINMPSEFSRYLILLKRCTIQLFRDWTVSRLKMVLHFFVGILIGLLYEDAGNDGHKTVSNVSFLMVSIVYLSYTSLMPAILKFPQELPVLKKERFNNWYKLPTYYIAYLTVNIPLQIAFVTIYSCGSYFLSNQSMDFDRYGMFLLVIVLNTLIAESFGLMMGTIVNPVDGTFLGAIWICAMMVMAGFVALLNHMPRFMYYVTYLSYQRYVLEALVLATYGFNRENLFCSTGNKVEYCHFRVPRVILEELAMDKCSYWENVAILFAIFLLFRTLAFFMLKRKLQAS